jgi:hypothetical protein
VPADRAAGHHCQADCVGCQTSFASAEPAILGTSKRTVSEDVMAKAFGRTLEHSSAAFAPAARSFPLVWHHDRIPPPTDFVIAFQHLVI